MATKTRSPRPKGPTLIQRSRAVSPRLKAGYAMGEGRVDREFFELSTDDETAITEAVTTALDTAFEE